MRQSDPTKESGVTTMEQDIRRRVKGGYYQAPEATNDVLWLLAERDALHEALRKCWAHGQTFGEIRRIVEEALGDRPE